MTNNRRYLIDFDSVRAEVRRSYEPWSCLYSEIEQVCRQLQHDLIINREDSQKLIAALLYSRTISSASAAVLVLEAGFDIQCRVLLRASMESMFTLVAIAKKPGQATRFIAADARERKRIFHKVRAWSEPSLRAEAVKHATEEKLKEIEDSIEASGATRISTEEMAKAAGLHDWYLTGYSMLSASVHASVRDLERHLVLATDGKIEAIRNEPTLEGLDRLYHIACELLLKSVEALALVFDTETDEFLRSSVETLADLRKTIEE